MNVRGFGRSSSHRRRTCRHRGTSRGRNPWRKAATAGASGSWRGRLSASGEHRQTPATDIITPRSWSLRKLPLAAGVQASVRQPKRKRRVRMTITRTKQTALASVTGHDPLSDAVRCPAQKPNRSSPHTCGARCLMRLAHFMHLDESAARNWPSNTNRPITPNVLTNQIRRFRHSFKARLTTRTMSNRSTTAPMKAVKMVLMMPTPMAMPNVAKQPAAEKWRQ